MALQKLKITASVDDIQLITRVAARLNTSLTAEGKIEVINITQDGSTRNASLSRQLPQYAGLLFENFRD